MRVKPSTDMGHRLSSLVLRVGVLVGVVLMNDFCYGDDWPQWRGANRDGAWTETGIVERFDSSEIEAKWRVPIGAGYSGPTVAAGRVYVHDRVTDPEQIERVHCFDWQTGEKIWTHAYPCRYEGFGYRAGPRASVLVEDDRAYSFGATGHLHCFNASDGTVLWQRDLLDQYKIRMPNWGIAASPIIEGELIIVQIAGEGNACICAFDKTTGAERWKALPDDASYSAPIIIEQVGQRVLMCWTGDRAVGLEPATGQLHWEHPMPWKSWPIAIATPVLHQDLLVLSESHRGTTVLRLSEDELQVEEVWSRKKSDLEDGKALHCLNSTPYVDGDHIYGADSRGILRCLRLDTGVQVWEDDSAVPEDRFATIHLIPNGDRTWLFNERGELIIAQLSPRGYNEISRAKLIDPTLPQLNRRGGVTWSHPAFAYRHVFARNDEELVCADLSAE